MPDYPPDYPPEWETDALLADGGVVHIRPISADDADRHARFVAALSPETKYLRFFGPRTELSRKEVEHFVTVDYHRRMALVALAADDIIAVARYDALERGDAEVAFVIADEHQGRGLGTLLLEYLAEAARREGITRFVAEVLPTNQRMLRVFREAGYDVLHHFASDGVVHVEFPLEPTTALEENIERRERTAEEHSVARLLEPQSVAVVGASHKPGTIGYHLFLNLLAGGFEGPVYPVNPNTPHVASVPTYASIEDLPHDVDLAIIVVPAPAVLGVIEQCGRKGVRGAVVISAGFSEAGPEGAKHEHEIVRAARAAGMRLIGPNCMGIANLSLGLNATFAPTAPAAGRVGFLSQSGALGIALLDWTARRGFGISTFVSVGNKADISGNDLLQYWEDDTATDVILLYLESLGNPQKFSRLARRISKHKPIVAVKSGRSAAGSRAASSHTAAAASTEAAVTALFQQTGVLRVDTLEELFDLADVLSSQPLPAGNRVAIVGNSGGPGILAADACTAAGLEVAPLASETQAVLRDTLGPNAAVANPVDMVASATPAHYEATIRAVLADHGVDSLIVIFTPPLVTRPDEVAAAVATATASATKPVVANFLASRETPGALKGDDRGHSRIPLFLSPEPAAIALGRCAQYAVWKERPLGSIPSFDDARRDDARELIDGFLHANPEGGWLPAPLAAKLLGSYGVPVADVVPARGADDAAAAARTAGFPVALKAMVRGVVHKTELGAVRLDLRDEAAVREAYDDLHGRLHEQLDQMVVQPMVPDGVETIVGLVQDASFGPLVMFGMGGIATELLADRAFRMLPMTDIDATELVRSLRASPLLFGYRNTPPADVRALEQLVLRVAALATDASELAELDLNPVITSEHGAVAVDVKARLAPVAPPGPAMRALRPA